MIFNGMLDLQGMRRCYRLRLILHRGFPNSVCLLAPAEQMLLELTAEVPSRQAVNEEVHAIVSQKDRSDDVLPTSGNVQLDQFVAGMRHLLDLDLELPHEVVTPHDEVGEVEHDGSCGYDQKDALELHLDAVLRHDPAPDRTPVDLTHLPDNANVEAGGQNEWDYSDQGSVDGVQDETVETLAEVPRTNRHVEPGRLNADQERLVHADEDRRRGDQSQKFDGRSSLADGPPLKREAYPDEPLDCERDDEPNRCKPENVRTERIRLAHTGNGDQIDRPTPRPAWKPVQEPFQQGVSQQDAGVGDCQRCQIDAARHLAHALR